MKYLVNQDRFFRDPFQLLESFERDLTNFNNLLNRNSQGFKEVQTLTPSAQWKEKEDFYLLEVEIPGAKKEDIEIHIKNNMISISGEKRKGTEFQMRFERSFSLPYSIDEANIQAHYEDGILQIGLPKAMESKGRKIEIESNKSDGFWTKLLGSKSNETPEDKH